MSTHDTRSIYERAGGDAPFRQLVDVFYRNVVADPLLRPMFPEDLEPGKEWQFLFITQYFGGPTRYIEQRGHPRLRLRHLGPQWRHRLRASASPGGTLRALGLGVAAVAWGGRRSQRCY